MQNRQKNCTDKKNCTDNADAIFSIFTFSDPCSSIVFSESVTNVVHEDVHDGGPAHLLCELGGGCGKKMAVLIFISFEDKEIKNDGDA